MARERTDTITLYVGKVLRDAWASVLEHEQAHGECLPCSRGTGKSALGRRMLYRFLESYRFLPSVESACRAHEMWLVNNENENR